MPQSNVLKNLIEKGYDEISPAWSASRPASIRDEYLKKLIARLSPGASVLELGCGGGLPSTKTLISHGLNATGVDISAGQIALARENVPQATLIHADMMDISFPPDSFNAVVAFYSIFHLPREEQGILIGRIKHWLRKGGWLLCNLHTEDGDFERENWFSPGVTMFSSGLGVEGNRDMFAREGDWLNIVEDEVVVEKVGSSEETFHWVFGIKGVGTDVNQKNG